MSPNSLIMPSLIKELFLYIGNFYIYSMMGISRSSTCVIAYLMKFEKIKLAKAL